MIIDLSSLLTNRCNSLDISDTISFELDKKQKKHIKALNDIEVDIHIYKDDICNIYFEIKIAGVMILECARTLTEIKYPFDTEYSTTLEEIYEENEKSIEKIENTLDISGNLWQNIVVEVPLRVISNDASEENIYGDGWKLVTNPEEDKPIDPRLEKLKDLL